MTCINGAAARCLYHCAMICETFCMIRGGGDLATGVVHRLHHAGFPLVVLELEHPRVVRRMAAVAQAMFAGEARVDRLHARRATLDEVPLKDPAVIPVVADPEGIAIRRLAPQVLIDARMAKAPLDTTIGLAAFVVGLGPGFVVGEHCHAVIETQRGHDLGRVLWQGAARPDTGQPEAVLGFQGERVLRAPVAGALRARREIGEAIAPGDTIALVGDQPVAAPFAGVLRGLLHDGLSARAGEKIGDLDPRGEVRHCFTVSDKALAVGGGVLEAVLSWLQVG